jgi:uncharacterized membrane protein YhaH (DUF805 family)
MSHPTQQTLPLDWPHYGIGFIDAIKRGFAKYATFTGRASLGEYWWWVLFVGLSYMVLGLLVNLTDGGGTQLGFFGVVALLGYLATIIPSIAVAVRRLHDVGRSGWWFLITFIPFIGSLILFIFLVTSTTPTAAQYGPPYPPSAPASGDAGSRHGHFTGLG